MLKVLVYLNLCTHYNMIFYGLIPALSLFCCSWVKVFRINPEFRIMRLTFHRKSAQNAVFREIIIAYLINFEII